MFLEKSSIRKLIENGIAIVSLILLWLSFLTFPSPQIIDIDTSWQLVLAHAFHQHWQAGVDYIFTYGPLGYFSLKVPNYDANLFYVTVAWWLITSFLLAVVFLTRGHHLLNWLEQALYLGLLIVILPTISYFNDSWFLLGIACTTVLLLQPPPWLTTPPRYFTALGIAWLTFVILSLTKFYLLIFIAICVVSLVIYFWQRYSILLATLVLLAFLLMFLGCWILCQQSLWNLPTFLANSWELASHYNEAMSLKPDSKAVWLAISEIGLTNLMMALNCFTKPRELVKFLIAGILLGSLFLGWKASFVRYDTYHFLTFFGVAMIIPFLLPRTQTLGTIRSFLFSSLLIMNVLVALLGTFYLGGSLGYTFNNFISLWYGRIATHTTILWSLGDYKNASDQLTTQLKQQYDLPQIRAQVGFATVDVFPALQGIILHNSLNYHPRPVFQGYVAYTESLLDINRNFYANPSTAPKFIIFDLNVIDNRFPTLEDSKLLNLILRDYQPLFLEKGLLLLEHKPRTAETTANQPLLTKVVKLGELVELPPFGANRLFLSLNIQPSLLGQLSTFLFQTPAVVLELKTTEGTFLTYRLIPSISNADFLLNPLLLDQTDELKWYLGKPLKQATTLRIMVESEELRPFFQPTVTVKLTESGISPYPIAENIKRTLQDNLLSFVASPMPDYVSSPSNVVAENGKIVLVVESPGELRFQMPKGNYKFMGQFGILPSAYNRLTYHPLTDGVEFSIIWVEPNGQEHVIFQKLLQPLTYLENRQIQPFEVTINLQEEHGELLLRTQALPFNNLLGKAAFWSDIQIGPGN